MNSSAAVSNGKHAWFEPSAWVGTAMALEGIWAAPHNMGGLALKCSSDLGRGPLQPQNSGRCSQLTSRQLGRYRLLHANIHLVPSAAQHTLVVLSAVLLAAAAVAGAAERSEVEPSCLSSVQCN